MRTSPEAISRTKRLVGVASSIKKAGFNLGSSWNAKWTCPLRYPKRVPITRLPRPEWYRDRLLPKTVSADRSLETDSFFLGAGIVTVEVISMGSEIPSSSSLISSSVRKCEDELKVKTSSSSSSSIFFFQWKYLLEKEKEEESWGVMVFISGK